MNLLSCKLTSVSLCSWMCFYIRRDNCYRFRLQLGKTTYRLLFIYLVLIYLSISIYQGNKRIRKKPNYIYDARYVVYKLTYCSCCSGNHTARVIRATAVNINYTCCQPHITHCLHRSYPVITNRTALQCWEYSNHAVVPELKDALRRSTKQREYNGLFQKALLPSFVLYKTQGLYKKLVNLLKHIADRWLA